MRRTLWGRLLIFLATASSAVAQPFEKQPYGMPFFRNGVQVDHPLTGGYYNPMHQFVDIDGDGDFDLFLLDNNDLSSSFYRNTGTPQTASFTLEIPNFVIPPISGWFRFGDINDDGRIDLLTKGDTLNTIAVYANTGTPGAPQFTLATPMLLDSGGVRVYNQEQCIPAFIDIDDDNDLDLFSLNPGSGTINFYENVGGPSSLVLVFRTDVWQNIRICPGCGVPNRSNAHGQGSMYFADVDGDSDFDMFYGDLFDAGLFFYQNVGTPAVAVLDSVSGHFPAVDPVITAGFNQPTLTDIDADGDYDLFVSVLPPFQQVDNFYFYRNTGTPTAYNFVLVTKNYLSTIDFGLESVPAFVDIDADGDKDLFVGDLFGHVAFVRNTGTVSSPVFLVEDSAFIATLRYTYSPAFTDIDADGDFDMFLGHFDGGVEYYQNTGSPSTPQFQMVISFFDSMAVGTYAAPAFFDIDSDGDQDVFVGKGDGRISFFRNNGSPQVYAFTLVTSAFQGIDVGFNAKPAFADVDRDGDADLVVGDSDGRLLHYRNDGPAGDPVFVFITSTYGPIDRVREAVAAFVDIDNDLDLDMFIGGMRGGLEFYRNETFTSVGNENDGIPREFVLFQNYPNPFNGITNIKFQLTSTAIVTVKIYDMLGREVTTLVSDNLAPGMHNIAWDAGEMATGVYHYRLYINSTALSKKMLLLR